MIEDTQGAAAEFRRQDAADARFPDTWERDSAESEEVPAYYKRRSAGIWACLAIMAVALVAAATYGYSVLREENLQISQIPEILRALPEMDRNLASTETLLATTQADQRNLAAQLTHVNAESKAALAHTRTQISELMAQTRHTMLNGVNQKTGDLQAQLSQLVNQQRSDQLRVSQLETKLEAAKAELARARKDYTEQLAALSERQGQEGRELATLKGSLSTRRVSFEIQKDQYADVAPGISLHVSRTDVAHQRFDGWIEALPSHQKALIQNQGIHSPVTFFPGEQNKPFLLVATRVDRQGVGGYVLIPVRGSATQRSNAASDTSDHPVSQTAEP